MNRIKLITVGKIIIISFIFFFVIGCNKLLKPKLESILVNPLNVKIKVGKIMQYQAIAIYSDGRKEDVTTKVTWKSSDTKVATISPDGLAIAKTPGTVTITANFQGKSSSATLNVSTKSFSTITIVDSAGKVVEIPYPVKRVIALHSGAAEAIRALGAIDRVVCISKYTAQRIQYFPELKNTPLCGSFSSPDYEKIIKVNPQVVIVYTKWPFAEKEVERTGIKVVRLDFYQPKTLFREIRTLGIMLGKEERAIELTNFFKEYLKIVESRVEKLKRKVRVYFESWHDYRTVAEGSGYHDMIQMAGCINVFAGAGIASFQVSPEAILEKNPQLVVKVVLRDKDFTGNYLNKLKAIRDRLLTRPGWNTLDAVRDNKVYVVTSDFFGGVKAPINICYLAKWCYPELFKDLDPEAILKEYFKKFQNLKYEEVDIYP